MNKIGRNLLTITFKNQFPSRNFSQTRTRKKTSIKNVTIVGSLLFGGSIASQLAFTAPIKTTINDENFLSFLGGFPRFIR